MNRPLVSICITTYNHEDYIKDCLRGALAQSFDMDLEILIGDDCSTDRTSVIVQDFVEKYPHIIKIHHHKENLGPTGNLQFLVERSRGEYIAHLDGDDYWMPGKLAAQVSFLQKHPECSAAFTNAIVVSDEQELLGVYSNPIPPIFDINFLIERGGFLNHSSLLYPAYLKQEILKISGDFIDYLIYINLAKHGKIGFINQALVFYRSASKTSMLRNIPETVRQLNWEAFMSVDLDAASRKALKGAIASFWKMTILTAVRRRQFSYIFQWAGRIRRESPVNTFPIFISGALQSLAALVLASFNKRLRATQRYLLVYNKR